MPRKIHQYKIDLVTLTDVQNFCYLAEKSKLNLKLVDSEGRYAVNAASILGVRYSLEWDNLFLISEEDVYFIFKDYILESTLKYTNE